MTQREPISAVVLDVEGTLVDCVPLILESWQQTLSESGHHFTLRELQPLSGMDGTEMLNRLLPDASHTHKQRLLSNQRECYRCEFMKTARPFTGVWDLFSTLRSDGLAIGIATSCQQDELAAYDKMMNVLKLTDAVICGDAAKHGKPDPDLLHLCLRRLEVTDCSNVVAVGDTPYDAQAARQLGIHPIGVLTGGFSQQSLRQAGCEHVLPRAQELGRHLHQRVL